MNAKKAKALRRAMRNEVEKGVQYSWVAHPQLYTNVRGTTMLKYKFQYVAVGGKRILNVGKKIYAAYGILPRCPDGKKD